MDHNPEKKPKNPHDGHRERMRRRMIRTGFDGFADHEILEMVLYYVLPAQDTNLIGHALLREFGSIEEVFRATYQELRQIGGVGKQSAEFIIFLRELMKSLEISRGRGVNMATARDRCEFFQRRLMFEADEVMMVACLDDSMHVVHSFIAAKGEPEHVNLSFRALMQGILFTHSNCIVIAHNHPHGELRASIMDVQTTILLQSMLRQVGVRLGDHIIVANGRAFSMLDAGCYATP